MSGNKYFYLRINGLKGRIPYESNFSSVLLTHFNSHLNIYEGLNLNYSGLKYGLGLYIYTEREMTGKLR